MAKHHLMLITLLTHGKRWCEDARKLLQLLVSTACTFCFNFQVGMREDGTITKLQSLMPDLSLAIDTLHCLEAKAFNETTCRRLLGSALLY